MYGIQNAACQVKFALVLHSQLVNQCLSLPYLYNRIKTSMIKFSHSVEHYPCEEFSAILKAEIEQCDRKKLPLEKGTAQGGYVGDEPITATVLSVTDQAGRIHAHVGIFFTEIVICCGCGDDPMPANAYCEMDFEIDRQSGEATIKVR